MGVTPIVYCTYFIVIENFGIQGQHFYIVSVIVQDVQQIKLEA